jgi:hypothetical protein
VARGEDDSGPAQVVDGRVSELVGEQGQSAGNQPGDVDAMSEEKQVESLPPSGLPAFRVSGGISFQREPDGSVSVLQEGTALTLTLATMDESTWCSLVLTMSAFSERPGDFGAVLAHHRGEKDMLVGQRGGY